jgi:hypothetical protein
MLSLLRAQRWLRLQLSELAAHALLEKFKAARSAPEKVHALRGIANSGYVGALDTVRPYLKDSNAEVRGAAIVRAIRLPCC